MLDSSELNRENSILDASIQQAINEDVRPYVESHGGSVDFVARHQGIVQVRLSGACTGCSAMNITLKVGIERMLRRRFREVDKVELA